jgi:molybdopterin-guanine dinucleotide biosynthesis protein A
VNQDLTVLLLAGGGSRRMGRDKPAIPFPGAGDPPLVARVHGLLAPLAARCLVAGPGSFDLPCRVVPDAPGIPGPLGGLIAGLVASETELVLVAAADLPLVEPRLAQYLVDQARDRPGAEAVVCRRDGRLEPLFALYRRSAAERLQEAATGLTGRRGLSLQRALARLGPWVIPEACWRPFDPQGSSFEGCNTLEELAAATRLALLRDSGGDP